MDKTEILSLPYRVEANELPDEAGIYFIMFNDEILYIGKSSVSIRDRLCKHETLDLISMDHKSVRFYYLLHPDLEHDLIRQHRPIYNKK